MSDTPSIDSIFCSAIEIESPDERQAFVEQACGKDVDLKHQVERLLHAHFHGRSILDAPVQPVATVDEPLKETAGTVIGPYKLLEQIGEGGFGVVFMAEQQEPIRRKVALKVIKPGMDTRQVIARFEAERQALALMDHPNIAKVLDAGSTGTRDEGLRISKPEDAAVLIPDPQSLIPAEGRPYFVMELVKGIPVTEYCDQNQLTPRERLELFVSVCQAVQHAHQKGIIHRDIKPSNVLISRQDATPVVKMIDFGIAKAIGQQLTDKTLFTNFVQMIGTPLYMSPEQAGMSDLDVDTRSDIYSLGVLLYELLTGTTPFDKERFKEVGYDEMRRIIREEEPPKPSTRISTLGQAATTLTTQRQSDPKRLSQLFRGELDWIVMKCLEKDRARRYETANELAQDLRRYLADEPVIAGPPSARYRLRKFVRRNRGPVLAAAIIFVLLIGGIAGTTVGLIEAKQQEWLAQSARSQEIEARERESERAEAEAKERRRAEAAEAEAKEQEREAKDQLELSASVIDFLNRDLLGQAGPTAQANRTFEPNRNLTVREAVDRAAATVGDKFKDRPELEALLRRTVGQAYRELGEYEKAIPQFRLSADIRAHVLGPKHSYTLLSLHDLAVAYRDAGQTSEAIGLFEQVRDGQLVDPGLEHPHTLTTLHNLATAYYDAGRKPEARALYEQVRDAQLKILGPEDPSTLATLANLAGSYRAEGNLDDAIKLYEQVRVAREKVLPPDHPGTLYMLNNLAATYWLAKQLDKSIPLFEQLLDKFQRVLGPQHPETLRTMANLGVNYRDAGRVMESIPLLEQAHRDGQKHAFLRFVGRELLVAYARAGRSAEAPALAKANVEASRKALPPDSPRLAGELYVVGSALLDLKLWNDAEAILRESLAIREKNEPDSWRAFSTKAGLGGALLGQQKYADAEPLLLQGYQGMKERAAHIAKASEEELELTRALERVVQLYDAWGKNDKAAEWRKKLEADSIRRPPSKIR